MAQILSIHHICIETADIHKSLDYYRSILGFELIGMESCSFGEYAMLRCGDARVELIQSKDASIIHGNAPIAHIGFEVDDVEALFQKLRKKGVKFKTETIEHNAEPLGGLTACSTTGPDGEVINFYKFNRSF